MRSITLSNKITLPIFLEFVEIRTKLASLFPMLIGFLWTYYFYGQFNWLNSLVFFLGALVFDMCVTSINNTMDFHKAISLDYKNEENVIGRNGLDFKIMVKIVFVLLALSLLFNLGLVFLTDPILLAIGAVCYVIGILYTFGPVPISRTPYGEFLSGLTMGFGIFFLAVFMTMYKDILYTNWTGHKVILIANWFELIRIFLMSIPLVCLIANIMLANNLRDLERDLENQRYTLVSYIGRDLGVKFYMLLSALPWVFWLTYIISGQFPIWALVALIGIYPHYQIVQIFVQKIKLAETRKAAFPQALKAFMLFSVIYLISLVLMIIFK